MSLLALIILAFAMSMDSFAVALSQGTTLQRPSYWQAIKIGAIFGIVEGITPIIGWIIGHIATQWIAQWDHWIAFILLTGLGLKILYESYRPTAEPQADNNHYENGIEHDKTEPTQRSKQSIWLLIMTAIGTSIDAMAIGLSLAFLTVNIWLAALMIGIATTIMATSGILLGHLLGTKIGRSAEIFGGTVLIIIGTSILADHLHWW